MHTYSEHQKNCHVNLPIPVYSFNFPPRHTNPDTCISKKSTSSKSDQTKKGENAEVGNYPGAGTYLLIHVCQIMYMNLEGVERKLTF